MQDLFARVRHVIGDSAEWAANDIVLGKGEFGIETDPSGAKLKIGDGTAAWSALPYFASGGGGGGGLTQAQADALYVAIGDKFTQAQADALYVAFGDKFTSTDADALYAKLTDQTAASGGAADAGKAPVLDAGGKLDGSFIPDLGATYVRLTDLVNTSGGAADAGKPVKLNSAGTLDGTFMPASVVQSSALSQTGGVANANKVAQLNANGQLDAAMINLPGVMTLKGTIDATNPLNVPATPSAGDTYIISADGTIDAAFTGEAAGEAAKTGDLLIYVNATSRWDHVNAANAAVGGGGSFLPLAGGTVSGDVIFDTGAPTTHAQLIVDPGTEKKPSVSFVGQTNTGMYRPTLSTIAFTTDGKSRMTIDGAGYVGIDQQYPSYKLDVNGDASINGVRVGKGLGNQMFNTAVGFNVLFKNSSGNFNTAIGSQALFTNAGGNNNTAIGNSSLYLNTGGTMNVAVGDNAMNKNTTGSGNTSLGYHAGYDLTTGRNNIFIGSNSGAKIQTGSNNVIIGSNVHDLPVGTSNHVVITDGQGHERIFIDDTGKTGVGTATPLAGLDVMSGNVRIGAPSVPASATAPGNGGEIAWDSDYIYVCVATNSWKRSPLTTW